MNILEILLCQICSGRYLESRYIETNIPVNLLVCLEVYVCPDGGVMAKVKETVFKILKSHMYNISVLEKFKKWQNKFTSNILPVNHDFCILLIKEWQCPRLEILLLTYFLRILKICWIFWNFFVSSAQFKILVFDVWNWEYNEEFDLRDQ